MTEEIIKEIAQAEEKAAEMKAQAEAEAAAIVAETEFRAAENEKTSEEVCKAYRATQLKNARAEAEEQYAAFLSKSTENARKYCDGLLDDARRAASKVAGRIVSGCK